MSSRFGLAYTSYAVRMLQGRDIMQATAAALPARAFIELCARAGAGGCQIDLSQLPADPGELAWLRADIDDRQLFVELSAPASVLASAAAFAPLVRIARTLGATIVRVPLLMGRRYESFASLADVRTFAGAWRERLGALAPAIEASGLTVAVENHKDFLAAELAALLHAVDSPNVGACLDFGNNLALLEEPMAVTEGLAPFVVTTHLKDMAVEPTAAGFELSEVPLGAGLLPLPRMVDVLRRARPEVHFVLEMITRDPLPVPCAEERYWATREAGERAAAERFVARLLGTAPQRPLPRTSALSSAAAIDLEDEHVRLCAIHARQTLAI